MKGFPRIITVVMLSAGLSAADARASADRDYVTAMTEFQQAEMEQSVGGDEAARRHLAEAKQARESALTAYRSLSEQTDPDVVARRRIELERLGKVCCGRVSLWDLYGIQLR